MSKKIYSNDLKLQVVQSYLEGRMSIREIAFLTGKEFIMSKAGRLYTSKIEVGQRK